MRIILDLYGWTKREEVSADVLRRGVVQVDFLPTDPLTALTASCAPVPPLTFSTINFQATGEERNGLPVFKA